MVMNNEIIGYLVAKDGERGYRIVGKCCEKHYPKGSAVYRVNVAPYKAICLHCGATLHRTGTDVELFDGT